MWERTVSVYSAGSESFKLKVTCLDIFLTYLIDFNNIFIPNLEAFAATGWRVGYLIGPQHIINPTLAATTRIVFCSNSPLQEAAAAGLEQAEERRFFETQNKEYEERRDVLVSAFDRLGLKYVLPQGSYFVLLVGCFSLICKIQILDCATKLFITGYLFRDVARRLSFPEELGWEREGLQVSTTRINNGSYTNDLKLFYRACWFIAVELGVSSIPVSEFYCEEHREIGERFGRFAFCKDIETLRQAGERLQGLSKYLR